MIMASVFSKILKGELPSYKIYEDDLTYAFLAYPGIRLGHTLVIPKLEIDYFVDVPEPHYSAVFQNAKKIARAIKPATQCLRVGTAIVGLEVPHFHYHLIPLSEIGDLDFKKAKKFPDDEMKAIQKKITDLIK